MTAGAHGLGRETRVEAGHDDVTAVAEVALPLKRQHEPIWRAVRRVARRAAFHERRSVLEHEGSELVDMTLRTLLGFEPPESNPQRRFMRVMARRALHDALFEAMVLVERELGNSGRVTRRTLLRGSPDIIVGSRHVD